MGSPGDASGTEQLEQAFFNDGYRLAKESSPNGSFAAGPDNAVSLLYKQLDDFIQLFLENAAWQDSPAHCKEGCDFCCHQAVYAQAYEFKYLKKWMFRHFPEEQLEEIRRKAKEKNAETSGLSADERLRFRSPCPLLSDGSCMVYQARPVACRIYLSKSVDSCRNDFHNPGDPGEFPQLFELVLRLGRMMNKGFAQRLKELKLDTTEYTIAAGLLK